VNNNRPTDRDVQRTGYLVENGILTALVIVKTTSSQCLQTFSAKLSLFM